MKRKLKGFTLVELVIVIAIVIILSVVSVPIYRGYTRNAKMAEGYALLGTILSAQKAYYSQYGNFYKKLGGPSGGGIWVNNDDVLGIDARGNKYFTNFMVSNYDTEEKYNVYMSVELPEDLRLVAGKTRLMLIYDITSGGTFTDKKY